MKAYFSIITLLITINSFSQVTFKKTTSTEARSPVVIVGTIILLVFHCMIRKYISLPKITVKSAIVPYALTII